jgi:hypothetical protein
VSDEIPDTDLLLPDGDDADFAPEDALVDPKRVMPRALDDPEVPEADAWEQSMPVVETDDERY